MENTTKGCPACGVLLTREERIAGAPAKGSAKAKPDQWIAECGNGHRFVALAARYERNAPTEFRLGERVDG